MLFSFNRYLVAIRGLRDRIIYVKDLSAAYSIFLDNHPDLDSPEKHFEMAVRYTLERDHYITLDNPAFNAESIRFLQRASSDYLIRATYVPFWYLNDKVYFYFDVDNLEMWITTGV